MEYTDISRKELAAGSDVAKHIIDKGIERNSEPSAMTAYKISAFLGVSLESLLGIEDFSSNQINKKILLANKYEKFLTKFELIPKSLREQIIILVDIFYVEK